MCAMRPSGGSSEGDSGEGSPVEECALWVMTLRWRTKLPPRMRKERGEEVTCAGVLIRAYKAPIVPPMQALSTWSFLVLWAWVRAGLAPSSTVARGA